MIAELEKTLIKLKKEFVKAYNGSSHIQEIIPQDTTELFPIDADHLNSLHLFAKNNPIYYNSFVQTIDDISCVVYEGDINQYWLGSIQHKNSKAPFSPTWILSAYIIALQAKDLGFDNVLDIGSGDGRIAYCAKILGLDSYSLEIDSDLIDIQKSICDKLVDFKPICCDATTFDYSAFHLGKAVFFIGGLAQMGGNVLANSIINNIKTSLKEKSCMVFAGTLSPKYTDDVANAGWSKIIEKHQLKVIKTVTLPTVWTFNELHDTPYIFCKF